MGPMIAVAVGGSGGWLALAWATDEAMATGGRLVVCHACPPDSPLATGGRATPIRLLELFDPTLARAVARTRARLGGGRVALRVVPGRPAPLLVDAAENADLIVVGPPSRSTPAGLGSITHHVAAHAPCPTVVVHAVAGGREAPFAGHVVVGVDDSAAGRAALEFGFTHAEAHRLPLAAVRAATSRPQDVWLDAMPPSTNPCDDSADLALFAAEVEPWTRKYPAVAVRRAVYAGRPRRALLRAAAGARLLVVGDHGHGRAVRALLATVSDGAIDHASCPVAITHGWERRGGTS